MPRRRNAASSVPLVIAGLVCCLALTGAAILLQRAAKAAANTVIMETDLATIVAQLNAALGGETGSSTTLPSLPPVTQQHPHDHDHDDHDHDDHDDHDHDHDHDHDGVPKKSHEPFNHFGSPYAVDDSRPLEPRVVDLLSERFGIWPRLPTCPDVPCVEGQLPAQPWSVTPFRSLTGPHTPEPKRALVVMTLGGGGARLELVKKFDQFFPIEQFDRIVFVYDKSDWSSFAWSRDSIIVRVSRQMKWWYIKRFVTPLMAASYDYVWFTDEDVVPKFQPLDYLAMADKYQLPLSAPGRIGVVSHHLTMQDPAYKSSGRWTTFVECGPVVVVSRQAYPCVYRTLDARLASGFGLDYFWCKALAETCGFGGRSCAILDAFAVQHVNSQAANSLSAEVYDPWVENGVYSTEANWFFDIAKRTLRSLDDPSNDPLDWPHWDATELGARQSNWERARPQEPMPGWMHTRLS